MWLNHKYSILILFYFASIFIVFLYFIFCVQQKTTRLEWYHILLWIFISYPVIFEKTLPLQFLLVLLTLALSMVYLHRVSQKVAQIMSLWLHFSWSLCICFVVPLVYFSKIKIFCSRWMIYIYYSKKCLQHQLFYLSFYHPKESLLTIMSSWGLHVSILYALIYQAFFKAHWPTTQLSLFADL